MPPTLFTKTQVQVAKQPLFRKSGKYRVVDPVVEMLRGSQNDILDRCLALSPPGALLYCDEEGRTVGSNNVSDRVAAARRQFEVVGLGADYVKRFIR